MRVFRLSKKIFSSELSGMGAALYGNRWNSKGTEIIYTVQIRALAMAEVAVHLTLATLPKDYVMIEIDIPDEIKIKTIDNIDLPANWNNHPHNSATQQIGDEFVYKNEYGLLQVPSAVVQGDYNYLINPYNQAFKEIKIVNILDFFFDQRLFK